MNSSAVQKILTQLFCIFLNCRLFDNFYSDFAGVFFFPTLAVILAVPAFTALTTPFEETVATFLLEVDHFTFPLTPVSFNVFVLPT